MINHITIDKLGKNKTPSINSINLSCPFGGLNPIACQNCRLAILLINENDIEELRKVGDYDAINRAYTCTFTVIVHNLIKRNKKKDSK